MDHIALYRQFRPSTFDEIVEQKHAVESLRLAVKTGKIGHAYLFSGQRGTGKTTIAKVFSRAINCEHPENGNPCNKCDICRGILDGTLLDVIEIDAASNNSVDNIRRICEEVNFAPSKAKFKVYIIDEVHMLSAGAFNALLKTLEEPPTHVVFLLATTEPHRLPATILSRCQRYDFRRIPFESIIGRLRFIADKEGFKVTNDALSLIASLSDGAMRDAVSMLDQACGSSKDITVTRETVEEITGTVNDAFVGKLADSLISGDYEKLILLIEKLSESGRDIAHFSLDLAQYFRDMLVVRMIPEPQKTLNVSTETLASLYNTAKKTNAETIVFFISFISSMINDLKTSPSIRTTFEISLIRLCGRGVKAEAVPLVVPDFAKKQEEAVKAMNDSSTTSVEKKEDTPVASDSSAVSEPVSSSVSSTSVVSSAVEPTKELGQSEVSSATSSSPSSASASEGSLLGKPLLGTSLFGGLFTNTPSTASSTEPSTSTADRTSSSLFSSSLLGTSSVGSSSPFTGLFSSSSATATTTVESAAEKASDDKASDKSEADDNENDNADDADDDISDNDISDNDIDDNDNEITDNATNDIDVNNATVSNDGEDDDEKPLENQIDILSMITGGSQSISRHENSNETSTAKKSVNEGSDDRKSPFSNLSDSFLSDVTMPPPDMNINSLPVKEEPKETPSEDVRKSSLARVMDDSQLIVSQGNVPTVRVVTGQFSDINAIWQAIVQRIREEDYSLSVDFNNARLETIGDGVYIVFPDNYKSVIPELTKDPHYKKISSDIKAAVFEAKHVYICTASQMNKVKPAVAETRNDQLKQFFDNAKENGVDTDFKFGDS